MSRCFHGIAGSLKVAIPGQHHNGSPGRPTGYFRRTGHSLALLLLFVALTASAQQPGRITGTVVTARDASPLPGVNVVVVGTLYAAVTDAEGHFALGPMPPGSYAVQVHALGYRPEQQTVEVPVGGEQAVDFRLRLPEVDIESLQPGILQRALQPVVERGTHRLREINVQDAGQLLRAMPGVQASRRGATIFDPNIRGLQGHQIGVYVDGARFLPPGPYGLATPLSVLDPSVLSSINVVKGPYALTWGTGNLGAVWVETLEASPTGRRVRGSFLAGYTSNLNAFDAAGAVSGASGPVSYRLQGSLRTGNDYNAGSRPSTPADFRSTGIRARMNYRFAPSSRLLFNAGYHDQQTVDLPGRLLDTDHVRATHASARYQTGLAIGFLRGLDALIYGSRITQTADNGKRGMGIAGALSVEVRHTNVGGRLAAQLVPAQGFMIEVGGDGYSTQYEGTRNEPLGEGANALHSVRLTNVGVFANGRHAFGQVEASGTVRVDLVHARAAGVSDTFIEKTGLAAHDLDANKIHVSAALTLTTALSRVWQVSIGGASVARAADVHERYADGFPYPSSHLIAEVWGNPSLNPERSTQADLWLSADSAPLALNLNVFARRLSDYITLEPTDLDKTTLPDQAPRPIRYANGEATFYGVEASATYALMDEFVQLNAGVSYLWGQDETLDEPALGIAPASAVLGWRLEAPANLFFLEGILHGSLKQTRTAASRGETSTGSFVTADLHLGVSLPGSSTLLIGLDNLTNTPFAHHVNAQIPVSRIRLAEPGRTFFIRLRYGM
ncbi:MAG: TonB-dependent receptor [Rhodothermales bacterium]